MDILKLIDYFENEYLKMFPDLKEFSVRTCVLLILENNKIYVNSVEKESLERFLIGYLLEKKDRFIPGGGDKFYLTDSYMSNRKNNFQFFGLNKKQMDIAKLFLKNFPQFISAGYNNGFVWLKYAGSNTCICCNDSPADSSIGKFYAEIIAAH